MKDKAQMKKRLAFQTALLVISFGPGNAGLALPEGMVVTGGNLSIENPDSRNAVIRQGSQRAAADFQSFNINNGERVQIIQPGSNSSFLGRITNGQITEIHGRLDSNGRVLLINPAGLLVGPNGSINTATFVATTLQVNHQKFLENGLVELKALPGLQQASVVNQGTITISDAGYAALIAPHVSNSGIIAATLGKIQLASGSTATLDISGDGLLSVALDPLVNGQITNSGSLLGKHVVLGGRDAASLAAATVHHSGLVEARNVSELMAEANNNEAAIATLTPPKIQIQSSGDVEVLGALMASTTRQGEKGGSISVEGQGIAVGANAVLEAKGDAGGGNIQVGGSWQNSDPGVSQALTTSIAAGALLDASATGSGDGGTVVAWSNIHNPTGSTDVSGNLRALGGPNGGNGGRIETSGYRLNVAGIQVEAGSARGKAGEWLLDPYNITIDATGGTSFNNPFTATSTSFIEADDINTALNSGTSVAISTGSGGSSDDGWIKIVDPIWKSMGGDATLTLTAAKEININADITLVQGNLSLNAGGDVNASGAIDASNLTIASMSSGTKATFNGNLILTSFTTSAGNYAVEIYGNNNRIDTATTFNNTSYIALGNNTNDVFRFDGGLSIPTPKASSSFLIGTISTHGQPIQIDSPIYLTGNTKLDTTSSGGFPAALTTLNGVVGGSGVGHDLTIAGNARIFEDISSVNNLAISGTTLIDNPRITATPVVISTSGSQHYQERVSLNNDLKLISNTGDISIASAYAGGGLMITLGDTNQRGTVTFAGEVDMPYGIVYTSSSQFNIEFLASNNTLSNGSFLNTGTLKIGGAGKNNTFGSISAPNVSLASLGGTISTSTGNIGLGPVELNSNTVINSGGGGNIQIESITGNNYDLQLISQNKSVDISGDATGIGSLKLQENAVTSTGSVRISGNLGAGNLITYPQNYDITLEGALNSVNSSTTFLNSGLLKIGNEATDASWFQGGINTALGPSGVRLGGQVNTSNQAAIFSNLELYKDTSINTGNTGANISVTGAINSTAGQNPSLTLFAGTAGDIQLNGGSKTIAGSIDLQGKSIAIADGLTNTQGSILIRAADAVTLEGNLYSNGGAITIDNGSDGPTRLILSNTSTTISSTNGVEPNFYINPIDLGPAGGNINIQATVSSSSNTRQLKIRSGTDGDLSISGAISGTGAVDLYGNDITIASTESISSLYIQAVNSTSPDDTGAINLQGTTYSTVSGITLASNVRVGNAEITNPITFSGGSSGSTVQLLTDGAAIEFSGSALLNGREIELDTTQSGNSTGNHIFINDAITGPGSLSINGGSAGTVSINHLAGATGAGTPLSTVRLINSGTATLRSISAGSLILENTNPSGTITLNGALNLSTELTTLANPFDLQLNGKPGEASSISGSTTFSNTGSLSFGFNGSEILDFVGGLNAGSPSVVYAAGTVRSSTGSITFPSGADIWLKGSFTLDAANNITLSSPVDDSNIGGGVSGLNLNAGGLTTINAAIGSTGPLESLTTDSRGTTSIAGSIDTTGGITFNDSVLISAESILNSSGFGAILLANTVNGPYGLTVNTDGSTSFASSVGATTRLNSLTTNAEGTTSIAGNIDTTGAITFNDALTLTGNSTLASSSAGAISFGNTVDGSYALAVNTAGTTSFASTVGATTSLNSLTTNSGGTTSIAGNIDTTGAITFNDALTLTGNSTLASSSAGAISFGNTVNGPYALAVNTAGTTSFASTVGATTSLNSLTTNSGGTTSIAEKISTTGGITFHGAVMLTAASTVESSESGAIYFGNTIDGHHDLAIHTSGTTSLRGIIGQAIALSTLYTDGGGSTRIKENIFTTGSITFDDTVRLIGSTTLTSTDGGAVTFGSTINGKYALGINTSGATTFTSSVGGGNLPLNSLTTDVGGTTSIAGNIDTTGAITFNDALTLTGNSTLASSSAGAISFGNTVNGPYALDVNTTGTTSFASLVGASSPLTSLTTNTGGGTYISGNINTTGAITFNDALTLTGNSTLASSSAGAISFGNTVNGPYALAVNTTGTTSFASSVGATTSLNSLTTNSGGTTSIAGNIDTTGAITFNDALTLNAASTLTSSGTGGISFASTVDGTHSFAIDAGGDITFNGAVGATAGLEDLTISSIGLIFGSNAQTSTNGNISATAESIEAYATILSTNGNIAFQADSLSLGPTETNPTGSLQAGLQGAGTITISPNSAGALINIGGSDAPSSSPPTLGLSAQEISRMVGRSIVIGSLNSGALSMSQALTLPANTNLTLQAGAAMSLNTLTVPGNFSASTNNAAITQTGPLNISGSTSLSSGSGNITLTNPNNRFGVTPISVSSTGSVLITPCDAYINCGVHSNSQAQQAILTTNPGVTQSTFISTFTEQINRSGMSSAPDQRTPDKPSGENTGRQKFQMGQSSLDFDSGSSTCASAGGCDLQSSTSNPGGFSVKGISTLKMLSKDLWRSLTSFNR